MCTMAINNQYNGIEITFEGKPTEATRTALKQAGFRWHGQKRLWYAKNTAERLVLAQKLSGQKNDAGTAPTPAATVKIVSKYGLKEGDILYDTWGYEQTNVEFYQVKKY